MIKLHSMKLEGMYNQLQQYFDTADPRVGNLTKDFLNSAAKSQTVTWIGAVESITEANKSQLTLHLLRTDISSPATGQQEVQRGNYMEALEGLRTELSPLIDIKITSHDAAKVQKNELAHHLIAEREELPQTKVVFEGTVTTVVR